MSTPHINAEKGDFAETVLMPGDPYRSQMIAENYLKDARLVNDVRGVKGYTGIYEGRKVSVMASGMGMPSMGIYSYELFSFFGVDNIIRIGSAGSYRADVKLRDIVIGQAACTDSAFIKQYELPGDFSPIADFGLLEKAVSAARRLGLSYHVGNILSSDRFYTESVSPDRAPAALWSKMGVLAVEMEAAALYANAARTGKKALAVCTVSDSLVTGEETTAAERQNSFTDMIKLALETAVSL